MVSGTDTKEVIRAMLGRHLNMGGLSDDADIFATGTVNSMFAMQLVQFVESQFGITVESEDLDIDNFRSVNVIAQFIARKQAMGSAG